MIGAGGGDVGKLTVGYENKQNLNSRTGTSSNTYIQIEQEIRK